MILANAAHALIDERKLRDYVLDPAHPEGRHKARIIASATGLGRSDHAEVARQIRAGVAVHDAEPSGSIPYGERFAVVLSLTGPKGSLRVRTAWIYRLGEDVPRFTTLYPDAGP